MNNQRRRTNRQGLGVARQRAARTKRLSSRPLFAERLEDRRLLALLLDGTYQRSYHNPIVPADVTGDYSVSPRDALVVISELNRNGSRSLPASAEAEAASVVTGKIDVSGDNVLSPIDALLVITALNNGEGAGEVLAFGIQVLDADGNVLPDNRVKAGDEFRMQATVQDLRTPIDENDILGVFTAYLDVHYSNDIDNSQELFTLGGIDPSEFPDIDSFDAFWMPGTATWSPSGYFAQPWRYGTAPNWNYPDNDQTPNEFDEIGAFQFDLNPPNVGNAVIPLVYGQLTASLPFDQPGTITFQSNPAELSPAHDTIFWNDTSSRVLPHQIIFGNASVTIYKPVYAIDDVATTNEDTPVTINVRANDVLDNVATGPLTVSSTVTDGPVNGTLQLVNNQFVYTPKLNFNGTDSFTYTAIDANGDSDTATVSITVNAVNDNPIAVNDSMTVAEDSDWTVINVLSNDSPGGGPDEIGQVLTVTAITQPSHGTAAIVAGNKQVQYKPAANYFGNDSFTYTISDGAGGTATATVSLVVLSVNDAPTANDDTFNNIQEDSVTNALDVLANDTIAPDVGETLTITAVNKSDGTEPGKTDQGGTVTVVSGKVNYVPLANFFGQDKFQYTISDGTSTDTAIVTVNVVNVNDAPIAADDTFQADDRLDALDEGTELLVLTNDKVGPANNNEQAVDSITIVAVSTPDNGGTVQIINGGTSLFYLPELGKPGFYDETFTYTIRDSGGLEDTATVVVNVEPKVLPRARNDQAQVAEDGSVDIAVLTNDVPNENSTLTLVGIAPGQGPLHGTATIVGSVITYVPDADYFGQDTFQYIIEDDFAGSVQSIGTVTVTVTPVNDVPIAVDDLELAPIPEDQQSTLLVLANDKPGPANETEAIFVNRVETGPSHGTIVKSADGKSLLYTPSLNYFGPDSFTYTVIDALGGVSLPATVNLEIYNVNDPPVAVDDLENVDEDSTDNVFHILANDFVGPSNENAVDSISLVSVGTPSQGGTVVMVGDTVQYTPAPDFFGTETFTYTIQDTGGLTDTATVTVHVADVNDAPTAGADSYMVLKNSDDQQFDVLINDSVFPDRPQDETLTIKGLIDAGDQVVDSIKTPHGTATVSADRLAIIYKPDADFETVGSDLDTFRYAVQDGRGGEDIGTVEVDVIDAVPSDLSGVIYVDANGDGIQQPSELTLAGVDVRLTGKNIRGVDLDITVETDVHGRFVFSSILPNADDDTIGYSITAQTPRYLNDGKDAIVDAAADENYDPGETGNDVFSGIHLGVWGTDRSNGNYSFGESGLSSTYIKLSQYLASSRKGLMLGSDGDGDTYWFSALQGWDGLKSVSFEFTDPSTPEGMASGVLTVTGTNGQTYQKTLSYFKDYDFAGDPRRGGCVIYLKGSAADFGFELAYQEAQGEGEMVAAGDVAEFARGVDAIFATDDWA